MDESFRKTVRRKPSEHGRGEKRRVHPVTGTRLVVADPEIALPLQILRVRSQTVGICQIEFHRGFEQDFRRCSVDNREHSGQMLRRIGIARCKFERDRLCAFRDLSHGCNLFV